MNRIFTLLLLLSCHTSSAKIFVVTNNQSSGAGSFADAVFNSNNTAGKDSIFFDIPASSVTGRTIVITDQLIIEANESVVIDGTTQKQGNNFGNTNAKICFTGSDRIKLLKLEADSCEVYGIWFTSGGNDLIIKGTNCLIGAPGKGNLFNNFSYNGLLINDGRYSKIQSNIIGLDSSGNCIDSTQRWNDGINLYNAEDILIGGAGLNEGNIISGNNYGIFTGQDKPSTALIYGNKIGTDVTGLFARPNSSGIVCYAGNYTIGGSQPGKGNIISGNSEYGIYLNDYGYYSPHDSIQGNIIGLNATGNLPLPNGDDGITCVSLFVQVGGAIPQTTNLIGANGGYGIVLKGCINSHVQGNYIGIGASGQHFGNKEGGIEFDGQAPYRNEYITIGGLNPGDGNYIAFNYGPAISFSYNDDRYNEFHENSIFCNFNNGDRSGILLNNSNFKITPPKIIQVTDSLVFGTAKPNSRIEVFGEDTCFRCEGENFLGFTIADAQGNFTFKYPVSEKITATQTDTVGTSEFTLCYEAGYKACVEAKIIPPPGICIGDSVLFQNASVVYLDDSINYWKWYFSDGDSSSSFNAQKEFDLLGSVTVKLFMGDTFGCLDSTVLDLKVGGGFNVQMAVDSALCETSYGTATDYTSDTYYPILHRIWDYGTGPYESTSNKLYFSNGRGDYELNLTDIDEAGCSAFSEPVPYHVRPGPSGYIYTSENGKVCENMEAYFFFVSVVPDSITRSYNWHFEDGFITTSDTAIRFYSDLNYHSATLTVVNDSGCSIILSENFNAQPPQSTAFSFTVNRREVNFINLSSDKYSSDFYWDFGDGKSAYGNNSSHTYSHDGTYIVTMKRLSNVCSEKDEVSDTVVISVTGIPDVQEPSSVVKITPNPATETITVSYTTSLINQVMIANEMGMVMKKESLQPNQKEFTLDIHDLTNGMYLLKLQTAGGWVEKKFVVGR